MCDSISVCVMSMLVNYLSVFLSLYIFREREGVRERESERETSYRHPGMPAFSYTQALPLKAKYWWGHSVGSVPYSENSTVGWNKVGTQLPSTGSM